MVNYGGVKKQKLHKNPNIGKENRYFSSILGFRWELRKKVYLPPKSPKSIDSLTKSYKNGGWMRT